MSAYPHEERDATRNIVNRLTEFKTEADQVSLGKAEFKPSTLSTLSKIAGTDEIEGQLAALDAYHEEIHNQHRSRLQRASYHDLTAFAEYMNPEFPPAPHHIWLCERLHAVESLDMLRLMVSMPPGHAKSTYCTHLFPAWYLGRHPREMFLQAGHTQNFVEKEFSSRVRGYIEAEEYGDVFEEITLSRRSYALDKWMLSNNKGSYTAKGVGQGISGVRAHFAGVDDPIASREDAESPTIRQKSFDWFIDDFSTRLLPYRPIFMVATRWHVDDLCGRLEDLNNRGKGLPWEIINLPAIAEDNDPMGRAPGEALWPDFYTVDYLNAYKATAPARTWNSLYRGNPTDAEGGVFKLSWLKRYNQPPKTTTVRRITASVDCANKDNQRADYTVITIWYHCDDGRHYLVDVVRERVEFNELVSLINATARRWDVDSILVEDKGAGTQYIQNQGGLNGDVRLAPVPVIAISTDNKSKEFRFDGVTPMFEAGEVVVPESAIWLPELETELTQFPGGKHDDQVDSISQYLAKVRVKGPNRGTKKATTGGSRSERTANAGLPSELPTPSAKIDGITQRGDHPDLPRDKQGEWIGAGRAKKGRFANKKDRQRHANMSAKIGMQLKSTT